MTESRNGAGPTANDDGWMSLRQAALALGESRQTVLSRIVRGELVSQRVGGRDFVSRASIEAVKKQKEQEEKKAGRTPAKARR